MKILKNLTVWRRNFPSFSFKLPLRARCLVIAILGMLSWLFFSSCGSQYQPIILNFNYSDGDNYLGEKQTTMLIIIIERKQKLSQELSRKEYSPAPEVLVQVLDEKRFQIQFEKEALARLKKEKHLRLLPPSQVADIVAYKSILVELKNSSGTTLASGYYGPKVANNVELIFGEKAPLNISIEICEGSDHCGFAYDVEVCNGKDDDKDGLIDEDGVCKIETKKEISHLWMTKKLNKLFLISDNTLMSYQFKSGNQWEKFKFTFSPKNLKRPIYTANDQAGLIINGLKIYKINENNITLATLSSLNIQSLYWTNERDILWATGTKPSASNKSIYYLSGKKWTPKYQKEKDFVVFAETTDDMVTLTYLNTFQYFEQYSEYGVNTFQSRSRQQRCNIQQLNKLTTLFKNIAQKDFYANGSFVTFLNRKVKKFYLLNLAKKDGKKHCLFKTPTIFSSEKLKNIEKIHVIALASKNSGVYLLLLASTKDQLKLFIYSVDDSLHLSLRYELSWNTTYSAPKMALTKNDKEHLTTIAIQSSSTKIEIFSLPTD